MWKEEILDSKFPFVVNTEENAENILFKDSSERIVLLKWIHYLLSGSGDDTSKSISELTEYFLGMGIVEGDTLKFVKGDCSKKHQMKVWKNLFQFAGMMKCSLEMSKSFADKHKHEMLTSYIVAEENQLQISPIVDDPLSAVPEIPDFDSIIIDLKKKVAEPMTVSVTEENKGVLEKLKKYIDLLRPISSRLKTPEEALVKQQKEFGNNIASLCDTLQSLESVLTSSTTVVSSLKDLERRLDDHLARSNEILKLAKKLKCFSGDLQDE